MKITDAPTITGILINPTAISIAQGDNTKSIEATPVVTEATGSWYAFVDGKYYRIYIPEGKKQVKIDRTSTDVDGEGVTEQVTFTSNNNKVVFNATGTTTATVDCNAEGKATVIIAVDEDATGTATITAEAGGKTAECEVTILKNVTVSTQVVNLSDSENVGTATALSNVSYVEGSTIELTATVTNTDYQFVGWYETKDGGTETSTPISTNASYTYTVPNDGTAEVVLKAKFEEKPQTLGTSASDTGVGYYIRKGSEYAIVFADRVAQAGTKAEWSSTNSSSYTFPTLTEAEKAGFKTYRINGTYTDSYFGEKNVLEVVDSAGEDRFMALALSDYPSASATSTWYNAANRSPYMSDFNATGGTDGKGSPTSKAFGKGKANTETMLKKGIAGSNGGYGALTSDDIWYKLMNGWTDTMKTSWTSSGYNAVDSSSTWGKVKDGWFIPSFEEWSVFGYAMKYEKLKTGVASYSSLGLISTYWSSSQFSANYAWYPDFDRGRMLNLIVNYSNYVRLATTF